MKDPGEEPSRPDQSDTGQRVGGVDGAGSGWVMATTGVESNSPVEDVRVFPSFGELRDYARRLGLRAVAVDIPMGLPDGSGRACDQAARDRLKGPPSRTSSVFPAPPLCVIDARNWEEANRQAKESTGKGLTKQSFALLPKIRDVRDSLPTSNLKGSGRPWFAEAHPEVSFQAMAGAPMQFHKGRQAGIAERLALLRRHFPNVGQATVGAAVVGPPHPGIDDLVDAVALAWTARRMVNGEAECLGAGESDQQEYPMNIWA